MSCHSFCDESGLSLEEIREAAESGQLLTMEMEFSQLCNFRCPYCYLETRPEDEMTSDEIRNLILQGRDLGVKKIIILGGEPMIYPRILEKIHFIRQHGMAVEIFTNGSNMTAENAAELAMLDVKVVLKMNSNDPDIQNRLCGIDTADRIIRDAFRNLKKAGYGKGGKPMAVSTVVCSENIDELPQLWRWLRTRNIDPYVEMITPQGSAPDNDWLDVDPKRVEMLFEELAEIDHTEFGREWFPQPPLAGDMCLRHQYSCFVNAFGDVMPCVGVTLPIGNVRDTPLAEILRDSEVLENLKNYSKTLNGPCADCEDHEFCYGCRGAAYQMTGDYLASDPLCWKNVDRRKEIDFLPMPVASLIPQQTPMQLVDRLLSIGEREAEVETVIAEDNPFLNDAGELESAAYIEIIAQAIAAYNGFHLRNRAEKPEGLLMGGKDIKIHSKAHRGNRLVTTVRKAHKLGNFGIIEGRIERDGECLAEGEIKVYHKTS